MDMKSNWRIKKMKGETTSGRKFDWILDRRVNFIIDEGEESSILKQLSEIIRLNPDEISLTHLKDNPITYLEFDGSSSYPCLCSVNPTEQTMYNLTKCSFKHGVEFTDTPIDVLLNTLMKDRLETHGDVKFDHLLSSVLNRMIGQEKVLNRFRDWSNGEKHLLYTLLQLHYMDRKNTVVILNHVDGHLHHRHWNRLIDELFNLNPNIQIICLTNSTDMIGDRWKNHILVFDEVEDEVEDKYPRYRDSYAPEVVEESGYEYYYDDYDELPCMEEERFWMEYIEHMESLGWEYVQAVDWGYNDDTGYSNIEVLWRRKNNETK